MPQRLIPSKSYRKPSVNGHRTRILTNDRRRSRSNEGLLTSGDLAQPGLGTSPKTESVIDRSRIIIARRARYNPLRSLTPDLLTTQMEAFKMGYLWQFALTMDSMARRDPCIMSVKPKREKAVSRHGYEIMKLQGADPVKAAKHAASLQYFYDHLTATDALEQDELGGFNVLIQQMMRATGFRYQVHEIVYKPVVGAVTYNTEETQPGQGQLSSEKNPKQETIDGLTATFRAVPLWFFENITGKLRYLKQFGELYGLPMEEGGWLVTYGDGLMEATAVAYAYKHLLALKDWANLSERWGDIKAWGRTTQGIGTEEWNAMKQALFDIATPEGTAVIKGDDAAIETIQTSVVSGGESCFERMIELMDTYITILWRGGDLSTMSAGGGKGESGHGTGASVQGDETDLLEDHDAKKLSETLNIQVDLPVIWYLFEEEPLAYIKISRPDQQNIEADLKIDNDLAAGGGKQKIGVVAERYSRTVENPDDYFGAAPVLKPAGEPPKAPGAEATPPKDDTAEEPLGNATLESETDMLNAAFDKDTLAPIRAKYGDLLAKLEAVKAMEDEAMQSEMARLRPELEQMRRDIPKLLHAKPQAAKLLSEIMAKTFFNALHESRNEITLGNGDVPGHEFHGNQWTGATTGAKGGEIRRHLKSEYGLDNAEAKALMERVKVSPGENMVHKADAVQRVIAAAKEIKSGTADKPKSLDGHDIARDLFKSGKYGPTFGIEGGTIKQWPSGYTVHGRPSNDFWHAWSENKASMVQKGWSVSKDYGQYDIHFTIPQNDYLDESGKRRGGGA